MTEMALAFQRAYKALAERTEKARKAALKAAHEAAAALKAAIQSGRMKATQAALRAVKAAKEAVKAAKAIILEGLGGMLRRALFRWGLEVPGIEVLA